MCHGIPSSSELPPGSQPRVLVIWLAAGLFIVSLAILLVPAFAFWCRRTRGRTGTEYDACATVPAAPVRRHQSFPVETLPAFTYARHSDESSGGGRDCSVCLGEVREGEMVRRLPVCTHVYHVECIDRWLAAHRCSPLCRLELDPWKVELDHSVVPLQGDPPEQPPV